MGKGIFLITLLAGAYVWSETTVDPADKYIYGANIGWINAAGDSANGAVVGESFCSGYMYGVNVGWISLGDGSPDDGMTYGNDSSTDFGVNHDGLGNLTGFAYGANIGWINFEQTYGQPKIDLETGNLSGYAWGANVGWISLGQLVSRMAMGPDSDGDGIPDAWEYGHTNLLTVLGSADSDGDGVPDTDEYWANTDPFDPNDLFRITDLQMMESTNIVTWTVNPSREYVLEFADDLAASNWTATGASFVPSGGPEATEEVTGVADTNRFYRVKASLPLSN